ncbi:MAG: hypothetical protein C4536_12770 [Actinobacteria bacterium]|nr:MAG: hypothetical protein C4536_12770 [Actinomycetota bacterium]
MFKRAKRSLLISGLLYGLAVRSFHPRPRDLLDPAWHREIPLRLMMRGLTRLLPALHGRYGEKGVRALQFVFYRIGEERAPILLEDLHIDPYDARSLGRVLDFEDGLVGVRGVWTEETRGRAVKEERYCPAARELAACPEVCTCLMIAMEAGTFSVINPDLKVPEITELLSRGDPCCLAAIELPLARREANKASPQATPGEFPPVLIVPGLQARLAMSGMKGVFSALWILLTRGPDQPMMWYEDFRYQPPPP